MKVVLIGTGNVATILGREISGAGHQIVQIVGRSHSKAEELSAEFNSSATDNILEINDSADIYIIAVSDDSVKLVAETLSLINGVVVHTAGALEKDILSNVSSSYGVLYPLQTLRKEMMTLPDIPVFIEGNNEKTTEILSEFCKSWASTVSNSTTKERLKMHVAAVMVSNFTNHLYEMAETYCLAEQLNFNALLPLIKQTSERLSFKSPSVLQTGPAKRGDSLTLQKHLELLKNYPDILSFYQLFTKSIISLQSERK